MLTKKNTREPEQKAQHTPAVFPLSAQIDSPNFGVVRDASGHRVVENVAADVALLFAAAPELLEALETALLMADFSKAPCAEGQARAAIAKARGQA